MNLNQPRQQLPWQRPNATEAYAAEQLAGADSGADGGYLAFPWASWIDVARDHPAPAAPLQSRPAAAPLASVGQHIEMLQHADLLRRCGVSDLFWSHATAGLHHHRGLRIHPFPLYPVRCATHPPAQWLVPLEERRWLYSFQGVYRPELYLTPVRQWILALPPRADALVEGRSEWHFEQQVYREQVHGEIPDPARHGELKREAESYVATLRQSLFALCPSGSGPNSIRLWEALGYGAIPVLLADTLALPGDPALWRQAVLVVPETAAAVAALPARLQALAQDSATLQAMAAAGRQLWQRYGLPDFCADVRDFLRNPRALLLAAAHRRLAGAAGPAQELRAHEPASLPLELHRLLFRLPPEQAVLLEIVDGAPLPLLELRWRSALQLCRGLLADRPWAISCRSAVLEELAGPGLDQRWATTTST
jgi:hypothetical protein